MEAVLLDTTVASFFLPQKAPRPERSLYEPHVRGHTPALSFQSVGELWKLAEKNAWPKGAGRHSTHSSVGS